MTSARDRASRPGHPARPSAARGLGSAGAAGGRDRIGAIRDALAARDPGRIDPETQSLMLRQLAVERFAAGKLDEAQQLAARIVRLGVVPELGHHEGARVLAARGEHERAASFDRLAARAASPERRAFFLWSAATHLEHAGAHEQAVDTLRRAARWASDADRALHRAHAAAIQLDHDRPVRALSEIVAALEASPHHGGYGGYLLGRIAGRLGDPRAAAHLRAFLRRHASSDAAVRTTLRWELDDALARLRRLDPSDA